MQVWVGFDMDECLGQFLSLWPFCELLTDRLPPSQRDSYLTLVAKRIEESTQHWLLRPGINAILQTLVQAHNHQQIYGCFLLSNNGSQELVEVVRRVLNLRANRFGSHGTLFLTGWSRNSPCRKGDLRKHLDEIQECLRSEQLPGVQRLLFFDDMEHVLAKQIGGDYILVSPYTYYTPVDLVYHILTPVFQRLQISSQILQSISRRAKQMEQADLRDSDLHLSSPPAAEWVEALQALRVFLQRVSISKRSTRKSKAHATRPGTRTIKTKITRTTRTTKQPTKQPSKQSKQSKAVSKAVAKGQLATKEKTHIWSRY